jgi:deoxyribose-phosphate aldolase
MIRGKIYLRNWEGIRRIIKIYEYEIHYKDWRHIMKEITLTDIAKMIDHSLLHPTMTDEQIIEGCNVAKKYDVATVCIKPYAIETAVDILNNSDVKVCTVVSFPHGNSTINMKLKETEDVMSRGAVEVDMVVNIGKVLSGRWDYVSEEIKEINNLVLANGGILKVIFENDYLEDSHIIRLCEICSEHSVAFVKTSTGYGFVRQENGMYSYKGATDHHLRLMRKHSVEGVQIKGAGCLRTLDDLLRVMEIGVTRIGATATESIIEEAKKRGYK